MKLSKVKKVCMDAGEIVIKKARTGIDINTWVGGYCELYPVRGLSLDSGMAIRIWEIEQKKLREINILEDTEENEAPGMITREVLESLEFLGDWKVAEGQERPGLKRVATIDGMVLLKDRESNRAWVFRESKLGPVEGEDLLFIPVEGRPNLIAIYANGMLEAVIYAGPWIVLDYLKNKLREIAEIYNDSEAGEE